MALTLVAAACGLLVPTPVVQQGYRVLTSNYINGGFSNGGTHRSWACLAYSSFGCWVGVLARREPLDMDMDVLRVAEPLDVALTRCV